MALAAANKSISMAWMLFYIIIFSVVSFTSPSSASYLPRKEDISLNSDLSLVFGTRNQTLSIESSPLSPLVHHVYLQIQAAVQTSYTIQVGNIHDGITDSTACSATALQSTCNLRSAWALCMSLIQTVTCPSLSNQAVSVTCTIVLPSSSSIAFNSGHGGAMSLSSLSSWASTCSNTLVTLSILSSTGQTTITGDGTSTSLFYLTVIPFVRFSMKNVAVMGFGDGSVAFVGAVYLQSLLGATIGPDVQFGPNNVGNSSSGALVASFLPSLRIFSSVFVGNSAVAQSDYKNLYANGGALTIISSNNILISNSTFVNNSLPGGGGRGGALFVGSSNNVIISNCKWVDNRVTGASGQGGALFFHSSSTITLTSCILRGNSIGGGGQGGALCFILSNIITLTSCSMANSIAGLGGWGGSLFVDGSNAITLTNCSMVNNIVTGGNNIATGGNGAGGSLFFLSSNLISIVQCTFTNNIADDGGAMYVDQSTYIGMTAVHFSRNVALSGAGGAVYVGASCSYISFGGPMPMLETCVGVCDHLTDDGSGYYYGNTIVQEPSTLHVAGYYVVFNDLNPYNDVNVYGDLNSEELNSEHCGPVYPNLGPVYAVYAPGLNGVAPCFLYGSTLSINYNRASFQGSSNANVLLFPLAALSSSVFENNVAATYGGAIFIGNSVNQVFVMPGTMFTGNTVTGNGGAVFLDSFSNKIYFYSTLFSSNHASTNGGAVAFQNLITSVHFYNCTFASNSAQYGGAIYFDTGNGNDLSNTGLNNVIEFLNMTMHQNNAVSDGGGIYANNLNSVSLVGSRLVDNIAGRFGGGLFLSQNNGPVSVNSTIFNDNHASSGGAVAMSTINNMSISTSTSFIKNSASTDGGAIFSNASNTITSFVGSIVSFTQNTCMGNGGALAMNAGSIVTFNGTTTFDSNYAGQQGGGITVSASSLVLGPRPIAFINNSALTGSAMYLSSSSTSSVDILIPLGSGCTNQTTCTTPLGYIGRGYVTESYTSYPYQSTFCDLPDGLITITLGVCTPWYGSVDSYDPNWNGHDYAVYSLIPTTTGGFSLLYIEQYRSITTGKQENNPCSAANYQGSSVEVMSTNCTTNEHQMVFYIVIPVAHNFSNAYGVFWVNAVFSDVGCTGTLLPSEYPTIFLQPYYQYHYNYTSASYIQGPPSCTDPAIRMCTNNTLTACSATGFTLNLTVSQPSTNWNKVLFQNNVCRGNKQGGTVFVVKDPQTTKELFGPQIPYYKRVVFVNNIAGTGKEVATQTTRLRSTSNHTTIFVTDYNSFLRPSLVFSLVDAHNNINTTDVTTTVTASALSYHCGVGVGHIGYLSGVTTVVAKAGVVTFDAVSAYCLPLGNMTIQIQAQPSGFESSYYVTTTLTLVFRQCHDGEVLVNNACQACPPGSYSFHFDPTATCKPCPDYTDSCAGGLITVSPGYWRLSPYSTAMLACPWPHACQGGDGSNIAAPTAITNGRRLSPVLTLTDTAAGCAPGYMGPLCAVCAFNYYFASTTLTCEACGNNGAEQLSLMVVIPILLIVVLIAIVVLLVKYGHKLVEEEGVDELIGMTGRDDVEAENNDEAEEADNMANVSAHLAGGGGGGGGGAGTISRVINTSRDATAAVAVDVDGNINRTSGGISTASALCQGVWRCLKGIWKRIKSMFRVLTPIITIGSAVVSLVISLDPNLVFPIVKIMTTAYQIVSNIPRSINLKFPAVVTKLFNAFDFVNFTSMNFGSPQCYYRYDYVDTLMLKTLAPLVVIGLLFLVYLVDHRCRSTPLERRIYILLFLLITYLVLPSVTVTIFGMFPCMNVDPSGQIPGTPKYMENDFSIACNSPRYVFGIVWACVGILVYPVGVLSLYAYLLWSNKDEIIVIKATEVEARERKEEDKLRQELLRRELVETQATEETTALKKRLIVLEERRSQHNAMPVAASAIVQNVVGAAELTFLFKAYKGQFWYWELIETARRLLLTAVLSVVSTGSSVQIVFGIAIALPYMKLYGYYQPYELAAHNIMQELAQYQVGITLFLGLLLRDNALPGSTWNIVLDVLLTFFNVSPSFASLLFMSPKKKLWEKKMSFSLFMTRLCALCRWRGRERGQGQENRNGSIQADPNVDVTLAAVDAPVLSSPSSISPRPHHRASSVRVHIQANSEKSPLVEQEEEMDISDASAKAVLSRPMESTDPGSPPRRRPSVKEQFVALQVSGKEFVDRLRTSGKSRESGHFWTPLPQEKEGMTGESPQSPLAMQSLDHQEDSQMDTHLPTDRESLLMMSNVRHPSKYKKKRLNSDVHFEAPVRNVLLPPSVRLPPMSSSSSSMVHREIATSTTGEDDETVVTPTGKTLP